MPAEWIAAIGSLSAALLLLILWFGSPIERASHRVNRGTAYEETEKGSYQHHLWRDTPERYEPYAYFPLQRWWRAQDRWWKLTAIFRQPMNTDIERYVSVTHRDHNREVTQTILSDGRYRNPLEAYHSIAGQLSLPFDPTKIHADAAKQKAYRFEGDDYVVFVWALSLVPKRRSPSKRPPLVTITHHVTDLDGSDRCDAAVTGETNERGTDTDTSNTDQATGSNGATQCPRTTPASPKRTVVANGCPHDASPKARPKAPTRTRRLET